jgi:voltage-gated potassium channel
VPDRRDPTLRHLALAVAAVTGLALVGTIAFTLAGEHPLDAFYRTANTITTAGMDSRPEGTGGKLVTVALLLLGVSAFLYIIGLLLELVVTGVASGLWQRRRMNATVAALRGHHVICGYGRVGTRVVGDLVEAGQTVVVIDSNAEALHRAVEAGLLHVEGDGSNEQVLRAAGIEHAASLVACADDDADNTYVVLTARDLRPDLRVIARASSESAERKLGLAGADEVVSPYVTAGHQIARLLTR